MAHLSYLESLEEKVRGKPGLQECVFSLPTTILSDFSKRRTEKKKKKLVVLWLPLFSTVQKDSAPNIAAFKAFFKRTALFLCHSVLTESTLNPWKQSGRKNPPLNLTLIWPWQFLVSLNYGCSLFCVLFKTLANSKHNILLFIFILLYLNTNF